MLVNLTTARQHLRVEDDYPEAQITPYLAGAEASAGDFLNRRIFASAGDLAAAIALLPVALNDATAAFEQALDDADDITDPCAREAARADALQVLRQVQDVARETRLGIVINPAIEAAILLTLGHLHENREDVVIGSATQLPKGAEFLLWPHRIGLGV